MDICVNAPGVCLPASAFAASRRTYDEASVQQRQTVAEHHVGRGTTPRITMQPLSSEYPMKEFCRRASSCDNTAVNMPVRAACRLR